MKKNVWVDETEEGGAYNIDDGIQEAKPNDPFLRYEGRLHRNLSEKELLDVLSKNWEKWDIGFDHTSFQDQLKPGELLNKAKELASNYQKS